VKSAGAQSKRSTVVEVARVCAIVGLFLAGSAAAQDLDPRRYINVPVDQNNLRVAGGYSTGEVNLSPSLPLQDASLDMAGVSLAYLRTLDIGGKASSFDLYLPYLCASGSAVLGGERRKNNVCGQGDARIRITHNFVGAPATEMSDFAATKPATVVGASLQVYIPVGQYDDDQLLNIGANRWVIKPELGMSIPWRKWSFEFAAGARFFADNDDFGDATQEQDPLYNLQVHLVYDLSPRQWISINGNYFFGGDTYVDSEPSVPRQKNSRVGLTWFVGLNPKNALKFSANKGVITRVGNDSNTVIVEWLYRWE
jgi:hypothetical protein